MDLTIIYFAVFIFLLINFLYTWSKQSTTALKVMFFFLFLFFWVSTINVIGVFFPIVFQTFRWLFGLSGWAMGGCWIWCTMQHLIKQFSLIISCVNVLLFLLFLIKIVFRTLRDKLMFIFITLWSCHAFNFLFEMFWDLLQQLWTKAP